jgi:hypothetical protein
MRIVGVVALALVTAASTIVASGSASTPSGPKLTDVQTANMTSPGNAPASRLSAGLRQVVLAQGSTKVENPSAQVSYYGYDNDVLTASGEPQMLPTPAVPTEAHKTEPDKNTYLFFENGLPGAELRTTTGPTSSSRVTRAEPPVTSRGSISMRMPAIA